MEGPQRCSPALRLCPWQCRDCGSYHEPQQLCTDTQVSPETLDQVLVLAKNFNYLYKTSVVALKDNRSRYSRHHRHFIRIDQLAYSEIYIHGEYDNTECLIVTDSVFYYADVVCV